MENVMMCSRPLLYLFSELFTMPVRAYRWMQTYLSDTGQPEEMLSEPFTEKTGCMARERAGQLLTLYGDRILRLAYSYLHNESDAEEILQETLLQYLRKTPVFAGTEHEKAWLLHVAANLSKNRIRYNRLRETDELKEELVAEEREDLAFVWDAVRELPEKYREVIHLFYQENLPTAQIAEILKRKETTVRSDLLRGRERLRKVLKEAYDFEEI